MSAPHVYRITKYDRDDRGAYRGSEDVSSDHGPVEAAYLAAVTVFAEDAGVTQLTIRDSAVSGLVHFGVEPSIDGHGLHWLFPPDLTGYHDGARSTLEVGRELVRAMLRDNGAWCRLESEVAGTLEDMSHPHAALGQHEQARAVWREALELYREQGRDTCAERIQQKLDRLDGFADRTTGLSLRAL